MSTKNRTVSDNPHHLYTMAEVAEFCGRSLILFRKYYAEGILPDPAHTIVHPNGKKTRRFNSREAHNLRDFFRGVKRNSLKPLKKRAERRKNNSGKTNKRKKQTRRSK